MFPVTWCILLAYSVIHFSATLFLALKYALLQWEKLDICRFSLRLTSQKTKEDCIRLSTGFTPGWLKYYNSYSKNIFVNLMGTLSHKKKLNSVLNWSFKFVLACYLQCLLLWGFPSTLFCCHAAVKPTICDILLNHENFGTDTLLPTLLDELR